MNVVLRDELKKPKKKKTRKKKQNLIHPSLMVLVKHVLPLILLLAAVGPNSSSLHGQFCFDDRPGEQPCVSPCAFLSSFPFPFPFPFLSFPSFLFFFAFLSFSSLFSFMPLTFLCLISFFCLLFFWFCSLIPCSHL
jgi:hypothetical protein